ncbi:MAG: hypothetical protein KDE14_16135 [Rhodobacteraceae bacterium]|nr:hypothetical protein [Paracoccaceae bacterium]
MPKLNSDRATHTVSFIPGDTRGTVFLGNPVLDNMMHVIFAMGAEMWTTKRRLKIVESLLAAKRDVTPEAIENYVPTPEEDAAWTAERDSIVKTMYSALTQVANSGATAPPV